MRAGPLNRPGGPSPLSTAVLADRYLAPGETTCNDVFKRVAHALAAAEQPDQRAHFTRLFYANLLQGAIGAGRIMANAGSANHGTMVNCFVHPIGASEQSV
ncbi:ribonucleotide reductase N-terminal alpha domain-containing protein, partial [Ralstonia sp.]